MNKILKKATAVLAAGAMLTSMCVSAAEPRYLVNGWRWPEAKAVMYFEDLETNSRNQANYAASDWNKELTNMFKFMKSSSNKTNAVVYKSLKGTTNENALAVTHTYHTTTSDADGWMHITKAPIDINSDKSWDTSSNTCATGKHHLRSVLRHEYGHVLGIAHSGLSSACMYPSIAAGQVKPLTSDDIKAGQSIYRDFELALEEYSQKRNLDLSGINEVEEIDVLYPEYTPVEFAANSSNIITGTVESIEPGYSDDNNVYSKVQISVKDNLKGTVSNTTISIPMFGGVQDETVYMYEEAPIYTVGEEVVLYLNDLDVEEEDWYLPISYEAAMDLNQMAKSVDKQTIIEQIKKDIESTVDVVEEGVTVGEPVEDIMLDWE